MRYKDDMKRASFSSDRTNVTPPLWRAFCLLTIESNNLESVNEKRGRDDVIVTRFGALFANASLDIARAFA
jgi:hypothetical protein